MPIQTGEPGGKKDVKADLDQMPLRDAILVKSAEFYLKLGNPLLALNELEKLPRDAKRHPWAIRMFVCAFHTLRSCQKAFAIS